MSETSDTGTSDTGTVVENDETTVVENDETNQSVDNADTVTTEQTATRHARKVREGLVVSNKMDKTAVVAVVERVRHAKYAKFVKRTKRLYAHDETNDVNIGDRVRVMETRPLSKNKNWRIVDVLERAK